MFQQSVESALSPIRLQVFLFYVDDILVSTRPAAEQTDHVEYSLALLCTAGDILKF